MFVRKVQSRIPSASRALLLGLAICLAPSSNAAVATQDERLGALIQQLSTSLGAKERAALRQIPHPNRQLLALRAYVKAGHRVESRWSWTRDEIERYSKSPEYSQLLQDLAAVRNAFEANNPGYTLYANTQVRSLDTQIQRWNSNAGVGATANSLRRDVEKTLREVPEASLAEQAARLRERLASWRPSPVAPLAAPGLSMHGRMRAIDFQIMRNQQIVAATQLSAVPREWDAPGWTAKLKRAVIDAGSRFEGPLQSPDEPWHYEYVGARQREAHRGSHPSVR